MTGGRRQEAESEERRKNMKFNFAWMGLMVTHHGENKYLNACVQIVPRKLNFVARVRHVLMETRMGMVHRSK